jgi:hypothetical protein
VTPKLVDRIPRERGDGEVWDVGGGYHLLVLPEGEAAYVSGYRTKDRKEGEWLSLEVERVAKERGLWLETSPGIDIIMVVVRSDNVATLLQACAEHLARRASS